MQNLVRKHKSPSRPPRNIQKEANNVTQRGGILKCAAGNEAGTPASSITRVCLNNCSPERRKRKKIPLL